MYKWQLYCLAMDIAYTKWAPSWRIGNIHVVLITLSYVMSVTLVIAALKVN